MRMAQGEIKDHIEALKYEGGNVRQAAFDVLVKIGEPAVPALLEALKDEDSDTRQVAAWALVKIGEPAVPALIGMLKDTNERGDIHQIATWILTRMGGSAVPALIEALKGQNQGVEQSAIIGGAEPEAAAMPVVAETGLPKPKLQVEDLFRKPESKSKLPRPHRMAIVPFGITELKVVPAKAQPGETVTISCKVTNNSDVDSYYPVTLRINGFVVGAEVISLPRRTTVPMGFTTVGTVPGDYKVEVNELSGRFSVVGKELRGKIRDSDFFKLMAGEAAVETSLKQEQVIREHVVSPPRGVQSAVDKVADYIESGLDKMGDGIIFPFKKLADASTVFKTEDRKTKKHR
jgi:hypothetical protein